MPASSCRALDMSGRALSGFRALSNTVNLVPIKLDLHIIINNWKLTEKKSLKFAVLLLNKFVVLSTYLSFPTKFSPPLDKSVASMEMR